MSVPIALITADTHLREKTWVARHGLTGDAYHSFRQLGELADDFGGIPIIAAGDLIDRHRNESNVVAFLAGQMQELEKREITFGYIQGQHELQYPTPWLSAIHDYPVWLDTVQQPSAGLFLDAETLVTSLDWRPGEQVAEALEQIPEACKILVVAAYSFPSFPSE
ncbi:MAG: hypothetical protein ACYC35_21375 [Pirellulales bacterium]